MESTPYGFLDNPNLPSEEEIKTYCAKIEDDSRGTALIDPSTSSVIAWVKHGPYVTVEEARTQDWTAKALRDSGNTDVQVPRVYHAFMDDDRRNPVGYIVMEYIEGEDCQCNSKDIELAAKALQALINLKPPPDAMLGHVGGGPRSIVNCFYPEWYCDVDYQTDKDFFSHIRKLFRFLSDLKFLNYLGDVSGYDRFLCPTDLDASNFRKRTMEDGRIVVVALDFGATCFMPQPFLELALDMAWKVFDRSVAKRVTLPTERSDPKLVWALSQAAGILVQYGKSVALPSGVKYRRILGACVL